MKKIAITQKLIENNYYDEVLEGLDVNWGKMLLKMGFIPVILPYNVDFRKYFNNIEAFIFGKDKSFFNSKLKKKIKFKNFKNIKDALNQAFLVIRKKKFINHTILFSPCAASFDSFKNFEERGYYFNNLIRKYLNGKKKFNT